MDWLANMMEDHANILKVAYAMKQYENKANSGNAAKDIFAGIVDFIANYADKNHHAKEEEALFPVLRKKRLANPAIIDELLREHEEGRSLVAAMRNASGTKEAARSALNYAVLIMRHIAKENVIFSAANKQIKADERARLSEEFASIEKKALGERGKADYADFAAKISGRISAL